MSNFKKFVAGISTIAMAVSMLVVPVAKVDAATAGEVYKTTDGTVWFITKDMQKRPFTSAGAFMSYGFLSFSQVKDADSSVTALPSGSFIAPQDGRIFCATASKGSDVAGECSLVTGGKKAAFTSSSVFTGQGYSFARAYYGDSSFLEKTSNIDNASAQHRAGTLINNNGTVQLVVSGGLWGTPSMDVFNSWGWSFADVVPANSADVLLSQTGVISARMAGELSPSATTSTPSNPGDCKTGEGSVKDFNVGSADKTSVAENQSDVELAAFDVKLEDDGCLTMDRFDLYMGEDSGLASTKPWDYFTDVHLLVDGKEITSASVDSKSDWTEVVQTSDGVPGPLSTSTRSQYRLRFSGLNSVFASNETTTVSVAFDTANNIDSGDEDAVWAIGTAADSFRFVDSTGFTFTTGDATLDQSFDIDAPDVAVLKLAASSDDIDSTVYAVSNTADTNGVELGIFNVEETNDTDVNITELSVTLASPSSETITNMVKKLYIYKGGTLVGQENVTGATTTFDNIDLDIAGDGKEDITVKADLKDTNTQVRYQDGDTLNISAVDLLKYTDAYNNDEGDFSETGSYVGKVHALYVNGINLNYVSSSADRTFVADASGEFDQGTFKITFEATAFGNNDQRIDRSCEEGGADAAGQGVEFNISNNGSNSTSCILTSSSTDSEDTADTYELDKGVTRTFTLTVVATASADAFAEVSLESVNWGTATNNTNANYYTFNLGDFKTDAVYLNAF